MPRRQRHCWHALRHASMPRRHKERSRQTALHVLEGAVRRSTAVVQIGAIEPLSSGAARLRTSLQVAAEIQVMQADPRANPEGEPRRQRPGATSR